MFDGETNQYPLSDSSGCSNISCDLRCGPLFSFVPFPLFVIWPFPFIPPAVRPLRYHFSAAAAETYSL
jgi:hypothetical protein